jgi:hypothetical protein
MSDEISQPIQPGKDQPNGQKDKGNLDEPAHSGNKDNGDVRPEEER